MITNIYINNKITEWHSDKETKLKIWEYIGLSEKDYAHWVETNFLPEDIKLKTRKHENI